MPEIPAQDAILPLIQLSITPVILISGLGSLVIAMTNRLGRLVDRTRILLAAARTATGPELANLEYQIRVMYKRGKTVQMAMTCISSSMFVSGVLIMLLFVSAISGIEMTAAILGVFILGITLMLIGLAAFVADLFVSLKALRAEASRTLGKLDS